MSSSTTSRENSVIIETFGEDGKQHIEQTTSFGIDSSPPPAMSKRKQDGGPTDVTKKQNGKVAKTKQIKSKAKKQGSTAQSNDADDPDTTGSQRTKSPASLDDKSNDDRHGSDVGSTISHGSKSVTVKAPGILRTPIGAENGDGSIDQLKSGEMQPAATSKPNMAGIVGARKLGVKWRHMIGSGAGIDDGGAADVASMAIGSETLPPAALPRAKGSDVINPTVNGMRQFGVSKGVITRAIVKFSGPPSPHPLTVCFHFPGTFLTHRYVLDMVRGKIQTLEGSESNASGVGKVSTIQFIDRNTIHGTQGMDNRWLVTLTKMDYVDILLNQGLHLFNRQISLRRYDEILSDEYTEFLEYRNLQNKLYAKNEDDDAANENTTADGETENSKDPRDDHKDDVTSDDEFRDVTNHDDEYTTAPGAFLASDIENDVTANDDTADADEHS